MKIPERFLIVDDDPLNNRLCRMVLDKTFGRPDVLEFTDPEIAVQFIEDECIKNPLDTIIFLDINMPVLSGWDVLDKLKDSTCIINDNFIVYILSSSIDPADKQKAKDNPLVTGYLEKPLKRERLEDIFSSNS